LQQQSYRLFLLFYFFPKFGWRDTGRKFSQAVDLLFVLPRLVHAIADANRLNKAVAGSHFSENEPGNQCANRGMREEGGVGGIPSVFQINPPRY
jgi:hypothetical protein